MAEDSFVKIVKELKPDILFLVNQFLNLAKPINSTMESYSTYQQPVTRINQYLEIGSLKKVIYSSFTQDKRTLVWHNKVMAKFFLFTQFLPINVASHDFMILPNLDNISPFRIISLRQMYLALNKYP